MDISAQAVKELREKCGAGMMDCKRALEETDGDIDEAVTLLRKKGMAARRQEGVPGRQRGTCRLATSTPAARSACWWRSTARPTSWPAPTSSTSSCTMWPCRWPRRRPRGCSARTYPPTWSPRRWTSTWLRPRDRQAGEGGGEDRRGQAEQVVRAGRAAWTSRSSRSRQDRRPTPARTGRQDRREHRKSGASPASSWAKTWHDTAATRRPGGGGPVGIGSGCSSS